VVVVLANGCFDPLHYGHLLHLQAARKLGDTLIVSVTMDECINKPGHPIFTLHERMSMLRALAIVDDVRAVRNAVEAINLIRPAIFVKGREYENNLPEKPIVESYGGRVVFTDDLTYSSTQLVTGGYLQLSRTSRRRRDSG
jgi:rfaE bifunctional protein nucleotidyltransferase chain/domain